MDSVKEAVKSVFTTQAGELFSIEKCSDPVFAEKALGDGMFIKPTEELVIAPISGKITAVAPTKHAYGITGEDGVELLIHVGIDSVELGGKGLLPFVHEGECVEQGDPLCQLDFGVFAAAGVATDIIIAVTNSSEFTIVDRKEGKQPASSTAFSYMAK